VSAVCQYKLVVEHAACASAVLQRALSVKHSQRAAAVRMRRAVLCATTESHKSHIAGFDEDSVHLQA
jgi:hypothetical protein